MSFVLRPAYIPEGNRRMQSCACVNVCVSGTVVPASAGTFAHRDIEFRARRGRPSGDEAARCPINFAIISFPSDAFSPLFRVIMRHLKSAKCY